MMGQALKANPAEGGETRCHPLPRRTDRNHQVRKSMAFKLTKAEVAERNDIVRRLEERAGRLRSAIDVANNLIEEAAVAVNAEIEAYNEILAEGRQFASTVAQAAQGEISEKSEKWQEGRRGEVATAWASEWEDVDLSEVDLVSLDPIEEPDHAAILAELPNSADEGNR